MSSKNKAVDYTALNTGLSKVAINKILSTKNKIETCTGGAKPIEVVQVGKIFEMVIYECGLCLPSKTRIGKNGAKLKNLKDRKGNCDHSGKSTDEKLTNDYNKVISIVKVHKAEPKKKETKNNEITELASILEKLPKKQREQLLDALTTTAAKNQ